MRMDKPTKTEGEYFAREDAEKMKRLKERIRQEILEEQKQNIKYICYMKCPKCGGALNEVIFRGVKIDKCGICRGVWLGNGELQKLAGHEERSIIKEIIDLFRPH